MGRERLRKDRQQKSYDRKEFHSVVDPHSFFADPDPAVLLKADRSKLLV